MGAGGSRTSDPSALRARVLSGLALVVVLGGSSLEAQTGAGQRNLTFGNVIQGIPVTVLKTDGTRAARFRVNLGVITSSITFGLPTVLNGPAAATMPITFGATAGGYSTSGNINGQTSFNPATGFSIFLPLGGTVTVWLGGTVSPAVSQQTGSYTATITIFVNGL